MHNVDVMQIAAFAMLRETRNTFISLEFEYDNMMGNSSPAHFNFTNPSMFLKTLHGQRSYSESTNGKYYWCVRAVTKCSK